MKQMWHSPLRLLLGLGVASGLMLSAPKAEAANQITLIFGPLNRSIGVSELEDLANKKTAAGDLKMILAISKQSYEKAGGLLNQTIPFGLIPADRLLNSPAGEAILDRVGKIVAPRSSNSMGKQALRAAIILSLADDGKMTPLELLHKYPTEMRVNLEELLKASKEFKDIPSLIQGFGGAMGGR
jgi:hypothetical protein